MGVTSEQVAEFSAKDVRVKITGSTLGDYWIASDGDEFKIFRSEFIVGASEVPQFLGHAGVAEKLADFKRKIPSTIVGGETQKQMSLEDLD